jgi:hypothetical protein
VRVQPRKFFLRVPMVMAKPDPEPLCQLLVPPQPAEIQSNAIRAETLRICGLLLCCCRAIYRRAVGSDLFGRVVGSELRLNSASTAACRKRVPSRLTSQLTIVCHISASASTGLFRRRRPSRPGQPGDLTEELAGPAIKLRHLICPQVMTSQAGDASRFGLNALIC